LAGSLFAVSWYFDTRQNPQGWHYVVFFLILAMTALCKGLVGPVVTILAILPDVALHRTWKKHLQLKVFLSMIPAAIVYVLPFWASSHVGGHAYGENGLYEVYRENIMRYFVPFDHKGPLYTYFIYLPIYLLPWTFFFIPALGAIKSRWAPMSVSSKWTVLSLVLLFLFFTLSGSRRSYYVLPIVPFAILMTADWILSSREIFTRRNIWAGRVAVISFLLLFVQFDVLQPLYYSGGGMPVFAVKLKAAAEKKNPWEKWNVISLDAESKTYFYLRLPPTTKNYGVMGKREEQTKASLLKAWPMLRSRDPHVIFISRKRYEPILRNILSEYEAVESPPSFGEKILKRENLDGAVGFIPIF
jgi:4-amino-4-deoxy-L-arabinose transferase-like glycosyltransferase